MPVRQRKRKAAVNKTTVNGITYGWDVCGECLLHINVCNCEAGPTPPSYLTTK